HFPRPSRPYILRPGATRRAPGRAGASTIGAGRIPWRFRPDPSAERVAWSCSEDGTDPASRARAGVNKPELTDALHAAIARNETRFREANERIEAGAGELDIRGPVPFLCECPDRSCI